MARFNSSLISNTISGTASVGSPFNGSFTALTGTAPYTVTLAGPTLFPGVNQQFYNSTSGTVTLSTPAGNFVGTGGSAASTFPVYAGNVVSITADGTNYIVISEDGSALTATSATISGVLTVQSSGGVAIAPSTTGTIDNVNVGATTRGSGAFNTLTSNNAVTFTAGTASSSTGTGTVVITGGLGVSGAINATSVSASLTGTIQTAAQPNITSVGSLTAPGLTVDTTTLVVDATNDRVGVGTAGPGAVLHVVKTVQQTDFDNANQILQLENTSTDTSGNVSGLRFRQTNGTNAANSFIGLSSTGSSSTRANLIFASPNTSGNATIRMSVNALGQVLIGTTSTPYSGATGTGVYINGVSSNQPDLASLFVAGAKIGFAGIQSLIQNQLMVYDSTAGNPVGSGGAIAFGGNAGGGQGTYYAAIESRKDNGTAGAYGASLNFYTRPDAGYYTSPNMTISSSGKVGIGTDSPVFLTEIVGGATTVETTLFQIRSNAGGIGTGTTIALANSTNATAGSGRVELAAIRDTASGASFVIRTGDSAGTIQNRVKINEIGNVGIGTTSPAHKLSVEGGTTGTTTFLHTLIGTTHLAGSAIGIGFKPEAGSNARFKAALVYEGNNEGYDFGDFHFLQRRTTDQAPATLSDKVMTIKSNGNVAIGATTPTEKLQISGVSSGSGAHGPRINLLYTGTSGGAESLVNFLDFRGVTNAAIGNNLQDDGVGTARADLVFKTATSGTLSQRMRIFGNGIVKVGTGYDVTTINEPGIMNVGAISNRDGRYVVGWWVGYTGGATTYRHIKTTLWGGGSPYGNSDYIMGGFHIMGYYYTTPGQCDQWITFHNWSGSTQNAYNRTNAGNWTPDNAAYVGADGYVYIRLVSATYMAYHIDLHQFPIYPVRNITVVSVTDSNASTI